MEASDQLTPPQLYARRHTLGLYRVIQKDGFNFVRLYFLNYTWYVIYRTFEGEGPKFSNTTARALA
jgi:hypothetical protein